MGRGARPALGRSRLRTHDARRAREGVRLRRPVHVRRRHVERRSLQAPVHAGPRCRAAVRAVGRPWLRRAACNQARDRASAAERAHVRPDVEDGAQGRRRRRHDHELQRMAGRNADRARARRVRQVQLRGRMEQERGLGPARIPRRDDALDGAARRARRVSRALRRVFDGRSPSPGPRGRGRRTRRPPARAATLADRATRSEISSSTRSRASAGVVRLECREHVGQLTALS